VQDVLKERREHGRDVLAALMGEVGWSQSCNLGVRDLMPQVKQSANAKQPNKAETRQRGQVQQAPELLSMWRRNPAVMRRALNDPRSRNASKIAYLQRTVGNQMLGQHVIFAQDHSKGGGNSLNFREVVIQRHLLPLTHEHPHPAPRSLNKSIDPNKLSKSELEDEVARIDDYLLSHPSSSEGRVYLEQARKRFTQGQNQRSASTAQLENISSIEELMDLFVSVDRDYVTHPSPPRLQFTFTKEWILSKEGKTAIGNEITRRLQQKRVQQKTEDLIWFHKYILQMKDTSNLLSTNRRTILHKNVLDELMFARSLKSVQYFPDLPQKRSQGSYIYLFIPVVEPDDIAPNTKASAMTAKENVKANRKIYNPGHDHLIIHEVVSIEQFIGIFSSIRNQAKKWNATVRQVEVFSHAAPLDGPIFGKNYSQFTGLKHSLAGLARLPYAKDAIVFFRGCNTGASGFLKNFAALQNVATFGFGGSTSFSSDPNEFDAWEPGDPAYQLQFPGTVVFLANKKVNDWRLKKSTLWFV
jgi:hypothetical protein